MHALVKINQYRERKDGTDLVVSVPDLKLGDMLVRKKIQNAEIRFDDGRHISAEQRKKAYATIRDIADWTGYLPEEMKEIIEAKNRDMAGRTAPPEGLFLLHVDYEGERETV